MSTCAVPERCPGKMLEEEPEQAIGKGMQEETELIGKKAMATQPVRRKTSLQLLDTRDPRTPAGDDTCAARTTHETGLVVGCHG